MEAPPVIAPAAGRSWWWLALALPLLAAVIVIFLFNPVQHGFYPRCALYVTTGIYCPGCGGLRASYALVHGNIFAALHDNLLLVLALPVAGIYSIMSAQCWLKNEPLPRFTPSPLMLKIMIVAVVLFTVLRNIPAAPFNWLAPL
jgi:hypothetical protein